MLYNKKQAQQRAQYLFQQSSNSGGNFRSSGSSTNQMLPNGIKSLSEVKNPQVLISFRFCDKKVCKIPEIKLFKSLTELDVSGNLLKEEVEELA